MDQLKIVTKEQGIKLRQLGFDWDCQYEQVLEKLHVEYDGPLDITKRPADHKVAEVIPRPSISLVLKWLEKKWGIRCYDGFSMIAVYHMDKVYKAFTPEKNSDVAQENLLRIGLDLADILFKEEQEKKKKAQEELSKSK